MNILTINKYIPNFLLCQGSIFPLVFHLCFLSSVFFKNGSSYAIFDVLRIRSRKFKGAFRNVAADAFVIA